MPTHELIVYDAQTNEPSRVQIEAVTLDDVVRKATAQGLALKPHKQASSKVDTQATLQQLAEEQNQKPVHPPLWSSAWMAIGIVAVLLGLPVSCADNLSHVSGLAIAVAGFGIMAIAKLCEIAAILRNK